MRFDRLTIVAATVLACGTPAPKRAPIANAVEVPRVQRAETDLKFDDTCEDSDTLQHMAINATESVAIVTCFKQTADINELEVTAYFVRRSAPTRGTSELLATWISRREQGEYYEIAAVVRDAQKQATHVLVRYVKGGLDQVPEMVLSIYRPARDAFDATMVRGTDIRIDHTPTGIGARVTVCNLAGNGGMYYQDKSCEQQQGSKTQVFTITPEP